MYEDLTDSGERWAPVCLLMAVFAFSGQESFTLNCTKGDTEPPTLDV